MFEGRFYLSLKQLYIVYIQIKEYLITVQLKWFQQLQVRCKIFRDNWQFIVTTILILS